MYIRRLCLCAALLVFGAASDANHGYREKPKFYLRAGLGQNFYKGFKKTNLYPQKGLDSKPAIQIAVGRELGYSGLSAEIGYLHSTWKYIAIGKPAGGQRALQGREQKGKLNSYVLGLNYDFSFKYLTPYITSSAGFTKFDTKNLKYNFRSMANDGKSTKFSWST